MLPRPVFVKGARPSHAAPRGEYDRTAFFALDPRPVHGAHVECRDCGGERDPAAERCPKCGSSKLEHVPARYDLFPELTVRRTTQRRASGPNHPAWKGGRYSQMRLKARRRRAAREADGGE